MTEILLKKLESKSNNYSLVEHNLHTSQCAKARWRNQHAKEAFPSCSIIIPFHGEADLIRYTLAALQSQDIDKEFLRTKVEIILVNDGTAADIEAHLKATGKICPLTYINLKANMGRSIARNAAIAYSKHEILIFLDADTVVQRNFVKVHIAWQQMTQNAVVVGLRDNISLERMKQCFTDNLECLQSVPDYRTDFRYWKFVPLAWQVDFPEIPKMKFDRSYTLLKSTNYFKEFGFYRTEGVWQLPYMVLASNMSIRREHVITAGGFDTSFRGWGMEDTHLAAKLIAAGAYVIPDLYLTTYHVVSPLSEEAKISKQHELQNNLTVYYRMLREPIVLHKEARWISKVQHSIAKTAEFTTYTPNTYSTLTFH